jgi:F-type H+-transporting ATPase subunit a
MLICVSCLRPTCPPPWVLAFAVLILRFWYSVKIKGAGGWAHELCRAPFGTSKNPIFALILGVINVLMQIIEYVAKTVSHGMRLFGNMYAGELVFMLIALMGGAAACRCLVCCSLWGTSLRAPSGRCSTFLVITLQAFIFMMLTLIYLGQAHDAH